MPIIPRPIAPILGRSIMSFDHHKAKQGCQRTPMAEFRDQQELKQLILVTALSLCFDSGEDFLLEEQIFANGFAPLEDYSKYCIAKLIDYGAVEFKTLEPQLVDCRDDKFLFVKSPLKPGEYLDKFVSENADKTIALLNESASTRSSLREFYREVMCCECIEYANYYAEKSGFKITAAHYNNAKLKLLSLELSSEKINALLWRAVKNLAPNKNEFRESVNFDEITDLAFNIYVRYKRSNVYFEGYRRPNCLNLSMLSKILELYLGLAMEIEDS